MLSSPSQAKLMKSTAGDVAEWLRRSSLDLSPRLSISAHGSVLQDARRSVLLISKDPEGKINNNKKKTGQSRVETMARVNSYAAEKSRESWQPALLFSSSLGALSSTTKTLG